MSHHTSGPHNADSNQPPQSVVTQGMATPIHTMNITAAWDGSVIESGPLVRIWITQANDGLYIDVDAPFHNDPAPPPCPIGPTDGLWDYEVVEVFFLGKNGRYTEIELAPSGHHLVLKLDGVRNPIASCLPLKFEASIAGNRWTGRAHVPKSLLPEGPLYINGYAIYGSESNRVYMSWIPLPGTAPDFHQPSLFRPLGT
jgi:hypothetical protein